MQTKKKIQNLFWSEYFSKVKKRKSKTSGFLEACESYFTRNRGQTLFPSGYHEPNYKFIL